jgi:xylose dehydrogenase (NAD/NADP)
MLADPAIDVVYIPLPNSLHVEWTVRSLEAGKHVLCEKPMALRAGDVDRIADAVRRTGRQAEEAFMYRHHPLTAAAAAVVTSGRLGEIRTFKGTFTFPLTRERDVRFDPALGGGSVWDVGCYPVSYMCFLADRAPTQVFGWQHTGPSGVDLAFSGMLQFEGDRVGQFDSGFLGPLRAEMEVVGRDASLRIVRPFRTDDFSRLLLARGDTVETLPHDAEPPFAGQIADMEAVALDGRPPRIPLSESRRTAAVIAALYASARAGAPISL